MRLMGAYALSFVFCLLPARAQEPPAGAETAADDALLEDVRSQLERFVDTLWDDPVALVKKLAVTVFIILIALGLRIVLGRSIDRAVGQLSEEVRRTERISRHAGRIESSAKKLFTIALLIATAFLVLTVWGVRPGQLFFSGTELGENFTTALIIAVVAWLLWHASKLVIEFLLLPRSEAADAETSARTRTLVPLFIGAARLLIGVMAALLILAELGLDIGPLLAGAGIAGLAIGFGAQSLVKDFLTGAFIILEDTVSVGDVAVVAGHAGLVEKMSVRTMRLRDLSGTVHTVPYGEIGTIQNLTKEFSFALMDIGVAYREDIDKVIAVIRSVADEQRADPDFAELILEPIEVLGLDKFGDSAIVVKCRIKTKPIRQWAVMRNFNLRLKRRFDAENIEIPFPHRTLYFGVDRQGAAPPMNVRMADEATVKLASKPEEESPEQSAGRDG